MMLPKALSILAVASTLSRWKMRLSYAIYCAATLRHR